MQPSTDNASWCLFSKKSCVFGAFFASPIPKQVRFRWGALLRRPAPKTYLSPKQSQKKYVFGAGLVGEGPQRNRTSLISWCLFRLNNPKKRYAFGALLGKSTIFGACFALTIPKKLSCRCGALLGKRPVPKTYLFGALFAFALPRKLCFRCGAYVLGVGPCRRRGPRRKRTFFGRLFSP